MKKFAYKLLCLALALTLALSLGACGNDEDGDGVTGSLLAEKSGPDPTEDPGAFLEYNMKNTARELEARREGCPLSALSRLSSDSGTLALSLAQEGKTGGLTASLSFDRAAGNARLDAALKSGVISLSASAYLDRDFFGVSSPELLGDDAFYGFAPYGLSRQADGSPLARLLGDDMLEAFARIDAAMERMSAMTVPDRQELEARCDQLSDAVLAAADLTVESGTVDRDGVQSEGAVLTADMDGEDMRAVLNKFQELFPEIGAALEATGEAPEDLGDLVSPDIKCRTEFVTDGCLIGVNFTFTDADGSQGAAVLNFFDGGGESVAISGPGGSVTVRSAVRSDETGWSHTVTADDGEESASLTAEYRGNELSVRFASPEKSGGFSCALTFTDAGFTADSVNVTVDSVTQYVPLTLTYTVGASVARPESTKNVFALTEQELTALLTVLSAYL